MFVGTRSKAHAYLRRSGLESLDRASEFERAASRADVVSGGVVEVGERKSGNAHMAGSGRHHRYANDLRGGGDGDAIEILAECADQDGMPETLNCLLGLMMLVEPFSKWFSGVALLGESEWDA